MKLCPACHQVYADDTLNFCLSDGTALKSTATQSERTVVIDPPDRSEETIVMNPRHISSVPSTEAIVSSESPKWPYIVIGGLGVALIAVLVVVFLPNFSSEGPNNSSGKASVTANLNSTDAPNYISPTGQYSGDWISNTASFGAQIDITEVAGKITGKIIWTLRSSPNPQKANKIGTTAVEYVNGTYNPQTRMLTLEGFRKDDPNGIIILDKYQLSAATDNQTIIGKSINGEFILKRQ